jgi:hypothetical protein
MDALFDGSDAHMLGGLDEARAVAQQLRNQICEHVFDDNKAANIIDNLVAEIERLNKVSVDLPEPFVASYDTIENRGGALEFYTEAQMLEMYQQGLEDAALVCMHIANRPSNVILGVAVNCAEAIRKLKEQAND